MKAIIFIFLISINISAIEFKVIGACSSDILFKTTITKKYSNVADLTIETLTENEVPHIAGIHGVNQIYDSPMGMDAYEILSKYEMRAHGWCYSVDGKIPEVLMNEYSQGPC